MGRSKGQCCHSNRATHHQGVVKVAKSDGHLSRLLLSRDLVSMLPPPWDPGQSLSEIGLCNNTATRSPAKMCTANTNIRCTVHQIAQDNSNTASNCQNRKLTLTFRLLKLCHNLTEDARELTLCSSSALRTPIQDKPGGQFNHLTDGVTHQDQANGSWQIILEQAQCTDMPLPSPREPSAV